MCLCLYLFEMKIKYQRLYHEFHKINSFYFSEVLFISSPHLITPEKNEVTEKQFGSMLSTW